MLTATILASLLTIPVWRQYLLPVLPLLILRTGSSIASDRIARAPAIMLVLLCAAGLSIGAAAVAKTTTSGYPVLVAERDAVTMRNMLAHRSIPHGVTSLSPERAADTGFPLDPRLAAGPFLFRTRDGLGDGAALTGVTQATFGRRLRQSPPIAIVVGGEAIDSGDPALDRELAVWAGQHGFRSVGTTPAGMTIFVRGAGCRYCRANRSAGSRAGRTGS